MQLSQDSAEASSSPCDEMEIPHELAEEPANNTAGATVVEDKTDVKEQLREELEQLQETPMSRSTVVEMSSIQLASSLAAFMLRYDKEMVEQFVDIRNRLRELFVRDWIQGVTLATGEREDVENDRNDIINILSEGRNARVRKNMELTFDYFLVRIQDRAAPNEK